MSFKTLTRLIRLNAQIENDIIEISVKSLTKYNAGVTRAYFATYDSTIWQFSNQDVLEPYF